MKSEPPSWKGLGKTLHRYTRKGSGDLWSAGYVFASCKFCGVGVVGFKARSDTFHKADRLERNGGIYWLFYGNLGREGSMLFCVSLSLFLHLNLRFSFRCQKKVCKYPLEIVACRSARRHLLRALPLGTSPCAIFLLKMQDA